MNRASLVLLLATVLFLSACAEPVKVPTPPPAIAIAKPVEQSDLGCSYFYFLWGSNAEYFQRFEEALEAYDKALICDPDAGYIRKKIPLVLLKQDETGKAVDWLRQAIAETPRDIDLYLILAHIKIQENKLSEAIKIYSDALAYEPENHIIQLRLGLLYTDQKEYRLAEIIFRNLLKKDKDIYLANLYLARLLIQINDITGAGQHFEKALALQWSPELAYEMADFYSKHAKYDQTIRLYSSLLEADDTDERATLGLVQTYLVMDKEQEAIAELNRLRDLSETPDKIDMIISKILLRSGELQKAKDLLKKVADEHKSSEANYLLALIYSQESSTDKALIRLEKIRADDVEFEEAVFLRTRILKETGKFGEAFNLLRRLVNDEARRRPLFYALLASLYEEKNESNKAIGLLKAGIDLYPDKEQLHFEYGLLLEKQGRQDEAILAMEKVLEISPNHPEALNYIGYTWADRNIKLDTALQYIKKAVELKPDNGFIRDSLGWVYYRLGRLEEARVELEKALALEPEDPSIHDHLGDVYKSLKNYDKARKAYRQALKIFTEADKKAAVEKKIRELNGKTN